MLKKSLEEDEQEPFCEVTVPVSGLMQAEYQVRKVLSQT